MLGKLAPRQRFWVVVGLMLSLICVCALGYGVRWLWIVSQRFSGQELYLIDRWAARVVGGIEAYRAEFGQYPASIEQLQSSRHRVVIDPEVIADGWEYHYSPRDGWELRIFRVTAERWRTDSTVYPKHYLSD